MLNTMKRIVFISLLISYASFSVSGFMLFEILGELGVRTEINLALIFAKNSPNLAYFLTLFQECFISFSFGIYFAFRMIRYKIYGIDCKLDFAFFIIFGACFSTIIMLAPVFLVLGIFLLQFKFYYFLAVFLLSFCLAYLLFRRSNFMLSELLKNLNYSVNIDFGLAILLAVIFAAVCAFAAYLKFFY